MMAYLLIFCFSVDGRPIYLIRLGTMDIKGLLRSVREDGFVKQVSLDFESNSREFIFLFMPCHSYLHLILQLYFTLGHFVVVIVVVVVSKDHHYWVNDFYKNNFCEHC